MTLPDSSEELELLLTSGMTELYAGVGGFLAYDLLTQNLLSKVQRMTFNLRAVCKTTSVTNKCKKEMNK